MVNNTFSDGCGLWIVDDVGTSMATKYDLLEKIDQETVNRNISIRLVGLCLGVDRQQTTACYDEAGKIILGKKGVDAIRKFTKNTGVPVFSLAPIFRGDAIPLRGTDPVLIEGERRPISPSLKKVFDDYLAEYGTLV